MAGGTYLNFDLRIERSVRGGADGSPRYRAELIASPSGEASAEFSLALPQDAGPELLGRYLFECAFSGEVLTALRRSQDKVARRNGGLRIRLRLADAPELADLPWEALYDASRDRFLALSSDTPLVRYLDLPEPIQPLRVKPPLRLLTIMASPKGLPPLRLEEEREALRRALGGLADDGLIDLTAEAPRTLAALRTALRRDEYHIIHFLGHGDIDPDTGEGFLLLENADGSPRSVTGQALGAILRDHRSLRLALLNACRGAAASPDSPFTGMAGKLVQQGIPAVVAMRAAVSDPAAVAFAHEFYAAIADGYAVDAALAEARKALFAEGSAGEWATPVLFMRAPDGRIFDMPNREAEAEEGQAEQAQTAGQETGSTAAHTQRARPAMGGDSISHYRDGAATLGCLVIDRPKGAGGPPCVYLLCDTSGICPASLTPRAGDPVVQPGVRDGGMPSTDIIAEIARWAPVRDDPRYASNNISAALATVRNLSDVSPELRGRGFLKGVRSARAGQKVYLVGRTSGQAHGVVLRLGGQLPIPWPVDQVIGGLRNTPDTNGNVAVPFGDIIECTPMIGFGDSGAILLDDENYALGLAFAGSDQLSLFIPLQKVLDALDVDLVTEAAWRKLVAPQATERADYDVFISYAPADRQWVFETLLPKLAQAGLRVIVDVRDFAPGRARLDNIAWAVEQSRHTIAVLTPDYIADEWRALETLAVRTADPAAWRRKLLPVRLKACATPDSIASIALQVADLTDPYAAPHALPWLVRLSAE